MESSGPSRKAIISLVVVVLLVIAATGAVIATSGNKSESDAVVSTSPSTQPSVSTTTNTSSDTATASSYKDGTYTATGSYNSPGGKESIDVSVTLSGGTITNTSITKNANDGDAEEYQTQFEQNYKSFVVGKKIADVNLSRVAGSSLTSNGFNSAIDQIKQKAES